MRCLARVAPVAVAVLACGAPVDTYDLVLRGGRSARSAAHRSPSSHRPNMRQRITFDFRLPRSWRHSTQAVSNEADAVQSPSGATGDLV